VHTNGSGGKTTGCTLLSASQISGWEVSTLAPLEAALATVIGPVAKVMVRQAARSCTDMASAQAQSTDHFYLLLAEQVNEGPERTKVWAQLRRGG
jgi:hypothetical protein